MFNYEAHFNTYLRVAPFSGYNIWSRPLYSLSTANSPFARCQSITNYGGTHGLVKTISFDFSSYFNKSNEFPIDFIDKIQTVLHFVYIELFGKLSDHNLKKHYIDRIKHYSLSFCLLIRLALLSPKLGKDNLFSCGLEEFEHDFYCFVNNTTHVYGFNMKEFDGENFDLENSSLDDETVKNINVDLARGFYRQGFPEKRIAKLAEMDLDELQSHLSGKKDGAIRPNDQEGIEVFDASIIIPSEYREKFSEADIHEFLRIFFNNIHTQDNDESIVNWSNLSNFGFIIESEVVMPNLGLMAILSKLFLYLEKLVTEIIQSVENEGSLTKPFRSCF